MAIETGDRVTVTFTRPGGQPWESATGRLTNNRLGWLTVQPDEGEPITIQRRRYKTDDGIWLDWIERAK